MTDQSPGHLPAVPAEDTKRVLAEQRAEALRTKTAIESRQAALKADMQAQIKAMQAEMEAQVAAMNAELAPLRQQIARQEEGIWTMNLYLGRDEEIVAIRDNDTLDPASADEPFVLRQGVLSMDEETAAYADQGGIDARHLDVFDEWIAQPQNLDRVLPERRGVVALVPRRSGRDYADPWMQQQMDEANRWTYFLLRNGERLYRMQTDYVVGKRLVPALDEFTGLFVSDRYDPVARERVREPLTPGTKEWDDAEAKQGARERHFMRMALILQGLVDRTTVFTPLPSIGCNLLDMRTYDEGRAVLLRDAEGLLTDGRPDFYTWLSTKTDQMRVGMRVMGAFNTETFRDAGGESNSSDWFSPNDRISPRPSNRWSDRDLPATATLYRLESRKTDRGVSGYVFKFERSKRWLDDEYGRGEFRVPKNRATCLVAPGDRFVLPFDLVTVEECEYYLGARTQRSAYAEMFPLLKATIEAKRAERDAERAFRGLLAKALADADESIDSTDPDLAVAHQVLDPLVDWWKFHNKYHRALVGDETGHEAKAIRDIVTEHLARTRADGEHTGQDEQEQAVVARLLDPSHGGDPNIMVIARKRDGGYLAFAPMPRTYPAGVPGRPATNVEQPEPMTFDGPPRTPLAADQRSKASMANQIPAAVSDTVWAREFITGKTGRSIKTRDWIQPKNRLDGLRILHSTETWETFDLHADPNLHLTDPEIDEFLTGDDKVVDLVVDQFTSGWPSPYRNAKPGALMYEPFEPLVLGVTLVMKDSDGSTPRIDVHVADSASPVLDGGPSAEAPKIAESLYRVSFRITKTRNGVVLCPDDDGRAITAALHERVSVREQSGERYSSPGSSVMRPWHYFWDGRAKGARALAEYPDNQQVLADRAAAIKSFNAESTRLAALPRDVLHHAYTAANRLVEAEVYAQFLDDYQAPDLWEGHRKTLSENDLEVPWHPRGREVPELVFDVLAKAVDAGMVVTEQRTNDHGYEYTAASIPGHTFGSLMSTLGIDAPDPAEGSPEAAPRATRWKGRYPTVTIADFLDLPLYDDSADDSASDDSSDDEIEVSG